VETVPFLVFSSRISGWVNRGSGRPLDILKRFGDERRNPLLTAFAGAFRSPDLRKKLLFTLGIIVVYRIGSVIPVPNVNVGQLHTCATAAQTGAQAGLYSLLSLFSGGALLQLAIFALGIMPYITASIILQLLAVVIPRLEDLRKEGKI